MSDDAVIILACVFLAAIPLNLYVAREVRFLARMDPPIDILSLLSTVVDLFAIAASVLGVIAFTSVVFLTSGIRLVPVPGSTIALIVVLLVVSFANVLVWRYLRRMRQEPDGQVDE